MERRSENIDNLGVLTERDARDVLALHHLSQEAKIEKKPLNQMHYMLAVVSSSFKATLRGCRWYEVFKRFKYARLSQPKTIQRILALRQLEELTEKVLHLEGADIVVKKKAEAKESVATSETV
jgi:hypothetical protein